MYCVHGILLPVCIGAFASGAIAKPSDDSPVARMFKYTNLEPIRPASQANRAPNGMKSVLARERFRETLACGDRCSPVNAACPSTTPCTRTGATRARAARNAGPCVRRRGPGCGGQPAELSVVRRMRGRKQRSGPKRHLPSRSVPQTRREWCKIRLKFSNTAREKQNGHAGPCARPRSPSTTHRRSASVHRSVCAGSIRVSQNHVPTEEPHYTRE